MPNKKAFNFDFFSYMVSLKMGTVRSLSRKTGISPATISRISSGSGVPNVENFLIICLELDLAPSHFLHTPKSKDNGGRPEN